MRILKTTEEFQKLRGERNALVLGNFDGVHRGHRQLISQCVTDSKQQGWQPCVLTFDPHPAAVVAGSKQVKLINTAEQRFEMIGALGIENIIVLPFDKELAATGPEEFVTAYLVGLFGAAAVYIGFNYSFGRYGAGTPELLTEYGAKYGFLVRVSQPVVVGDEIVSSTLVRTKYRSGAVAGAAGLLGYWPFLAGEVVGGDKRGRQLGFSTANLAVPEHLLLPAFGVYAAYAEIDGKTAAGLLPAVVNIGVKPTFDSVKMSVEVHILDFSEDLYGKNLKVHFREKLRNEKRFASAVELQKAIIADIERARIILST